MPTNHADIIVIFLSNYHLTFLGDSLRIKDLPLTSFKVRLYLLYEWRKFLVTLGFLINFLTLGMRFRYTDSAFRYTGQCSSVPMVPTFLLLTSGKTMRSSSQLTNQLIHYSEVKSILLFQGDTVLKAISSSFLKLKISSWVCIPHELPDSWKEMK